MGLTFTELFKSKVEGRRLHAYTILFDDEYPTGGEAVTAANVGLTRIDNAIIGQAGGALLQWDQANSKIKAYWVDTSTDGALMAEVVDTTDINADLTAVLGLFFGI